jgi:hypothetical protein
LNSNPERFLTSFGMTAMGVFLRTVTVGAAKNQR